MAGIFGGSIEDRSRESELDSYLNNRDRPLICISCGEIIDEEFESEEFCEFCFNEREDND